MLLVAVILAGGNREAVIGEAIDSVNSFVDHFVLVDSGESARAAIAVAREKLGGRCTVFKFIGEFDCAAARNFGLDCAAELGADWVLSLDTDERIQGKTENINRFLSEVQQNVVLVNDATWSYNKAKFIRLPRTGSWQGCPHEAYVPAPGEGAAIPMWLSFRELPKTPEEEQIRAAWVELQCRKGLEKEPSNSRLRFYRADALALLGRHDEAVLDFLEAARISKWPDEINWSYYRAAQTRFIQKRYHDALNICFASSMSTPELLWYAALCAATLDNGRNALILATRAAGLAEEQRKFERTGFCERYAWFEGPHEIMSWVYKAHGDSEKEREALAAVESLRAQRLQLMAA